jgi:Undecaprenyl-phosphate glucose phosphotransferase
VVNGALRLLDVVVVVLVGYLVYMFYVTRPTPVQEQFYRLAVTVTGFFAAVDFTRFKLYSDSSVSAGLGDLVRLSVAWTVVIALTLGAVFFAKASSEFSRVWLASWYFGGGAILILMRLILSSTIRSISQPDENIFNVAVIGTRDRAERVAEHLSRSGRGSYRLLGVFFDRDDPVEHEPNNDGLPKGAVRELLACAQTMQIDTVLIAVSLDDRTHIERIIRELTLFPINVHIVANSEILPLKPKGLSHIGDIPLLNVADKPISGWDYLLKWLLDKIVALVMIVFLSPVMAVVALAVKLQDGGPVFFRQKRIGFNNELIEIFKFRSMYVKQCDANASNLVTRGDARVTPVGRFIRKTSLDELPQLLNVLRGELSLVGPRPHATQAKAGDQLYDKVVDLYFARHKVKPGITGWAQINGWRGETDTYTKIKNRVEHDLYYIENWSIYFDLYILLRTPFELLNDKQAY